MSENRTAVVAAGARNEAGARRRAEQLGQPHSAHAVGDPFPDLHATMRKAFQ
jgi:hypothetical protein